MQPKKVFSVHTPSIIIHPVWCTGWVLVHSGPKSQRVKIYDSKLRVQSKGALFPVNCPHSFMELITTAVFVHCMVCCITTTHLGGERRLCSLPLSLSLSLELSLSFELHNLLEQSQVGGNANWFRKKMEKVVDLERFEKS
jgi:hypothetical protein